MLTTAAPPGFGLVRSFSANQATTSMFHSQPQMRAPISNAVVGHPKSMTFLDQSPFLSSNHANANNTGASNEEISTIFVVGFPDDMHEREFQNMFIFSPGFEAATLKVPTFQDDLMVDNGQLNNTRKQIIGFAKFRSRLEALESRDVLSGRKVDAEKGSVLKAEMAKKNLHTKRGLSNDPTMLSSSYPLMSPSLGGASQQQQHRKIGSSTASLPAAASAPTSAYEAFYSVPACLPSDLLSPQDYEYDFDTCGSLRCAETLIMDGRQAPQATPTSAAFSAAFNCMLSSSSPPSSMIRASAVEPTDRAVGGLVSDHRSQSTESVDELLQGNEMLPQPPLSFSRTILQPSRLSAVKALKDLPDISTSSGGNFGNGDLRRGLLGSRSLSDRCLARLLPQSAPPTEMRGFASSLFGGVVHLGDSLQHNSNNGTFTTNGLGLSANPVSATDGEAAESDNDSVHSPQSNDSRKNSESNIVDVMAATTTTSASSSMTTTTSTSDPTSTTASGGPQFTHHSLNSQSESPDSLFLVMNGSTGCTAPGPSSTIPTTSTVNNGHSNSPSRFPPSLSIDTNSANGFQNPAPGSGFLNASSPGMMSSYFLSSLGTARSSNPGDQNPPCNTLYVGNLPANANEEELRMIFSKCPGYKRMCFRVKVNGPMCFVEYEDVVCATQALHDLYGRMLSNSVKGGIRLSYSKNPLGVRQHPNFPTAVTIPSFSMYVPNAPLSAPPTIVRAEFGLYGPVANKGLLEGRL